MDRWNRHKPGTRSKFAPLVPQAIVRCKQIVCSATLSRSGAPGPRQCHGSGVPVMGRMPPVLRRKSRGARSIAAGFSRNEHHEQACRIRWQGKHRNACRTAPGAAGGKAARKSSPPQGAAPQPVGHNAPTSGRPESALNRAGRTRAHGCAPAMAWRITGSRRQHARRQQRP